MSISHYGGQSKKVCSVGQQRPRLLYRDNVSTAVGQVAVVDQEERTKRVESEN